MRKGKEEKGHREERKTMTAYEVENIKKLLCGGLLAGWPGWCSSPPTRPPDLFKYLVAIKKTLWNPGRREGMFIASMAASAPMRQGRR